MIVVCHIMSVSMIGMDDIDNVLVGMTVFFDLRVMVSNNLCQLSDIMRGYAIVGRQDDPDRQSDSQYDSQINRNLPSHTACFCGVWPTCLIPLGGYITHMTKTATHATHPAIVKRLKRANGHLVSVINMIECEEPCIDIAQQLHAVEKAILQAKRTLIQDHIDHCLDDALGGAEAADTPATAEFKAITKYL